MTDKNQEKVVKTILNSFPLHSNVLKRSLSMLSKSEKEFLSSFLDILLTKGYSIEFISEAYIWINKSILKEQIYFKKHQKYRHSKLSQVCNSIYFHDENMMKYMIGLALTTFFWPNHIKMNRWFEEKLPTNKKGAYLEIGTGHGYHLLTALKKTSFDSYEGIDLSPTSIKLTKEVLEHSLSTDNKRCEIHCVDFMQFESFKKYSAIIMGEVLEHVENPLDFLDKIKQLSTHDSYIYITTVINAPAVDHIYLFDTWDSLNTIIQKASLTVKESLILPPDGTDIDEAFEKKLPVNVSLILN